MTKKIISLILSISLILTQPVFAQGVAELNIGKYLNQMPVLNTDSFRPPRLRYISYDIKSNDFKLLLDQGDAKLSNPPNSSTPKLQDTTQELFNYFLIGLSLPNDKFWVNLRPDAPEQIIDPLLEKTDMGKIMLEADLELKKDTAGLTSPQNPEGKAYWDKLYKKAGELFGTENITIPTITRPWIVPGEVIIRESEDSAYIYKANLKVMLEEDYLNNQKTEKPKNPKTDDYDFSDPRLKELNKYSTQLIKELILPRLTQEINTSKKYAQLRQVFFSLILSRWFKDKYKGRPGQYSGLIDSRNLDKLGSQEAWSKDYYFSEYKKSFRQGEYNLKEQVSTPTGQVIRSYVSGGIQPVLNAKDVNGFIASTSSSLNKDTDRLKREIDKIDNLINGLIIGGGAVVVGGIVVAATLINSFVDVKVTINTFQQADLSRIKSSAIRYMLSGSDIDTILFVSNKSIHEVFSQIDFRSMEDFRKWLKEQTEISRETKDEIEVKLSAIEEEMRPMIRVYLESILRELNSFKESSNSVKTDKIMLTMFTQELLKDFNKRKASIKDYGELLGFIDGLLTTLDTAYTQEEDYLEKLNTPVPNNIKELFGNTKQGLEGLKLQVYKEVTNLKGSSPLAEELSSEERYRLLNEYKAQTEELSRIIREVIATSNFARYLSPGDKSKIEHFLENSDPKSAAGLIYEHMKLADNIFREYRDKWLKEQSEVFPNDNKFIINEDAAKSLFVRLKNRLISMNIQPPESIKGLNENKANKIQLKYAVVDLMKNMGDKAVEITPRGKRIFEFMSKIVPDKEAYLSEYKISRENEVLLNKIKSRINEMLSLKAAYQFTILSLPNRITERIRECAFTLDQENKKIAMQYALLALPTLAIMCLEDRNYLVWPGNDEYHESVIKELATMSEELIKQQQLLRSKESFRSDLAQKRLLISAYWKSGMIKTIEEARELAREYVRKSKNLSEKTRIVIFPETKFLRAVAEEVKGSTILVGAQSLFFNPNINLQAQVDYAVNMGITIANVGHPTHRKIGLTNEQAKRIAQAILQDGRLSLWYTIEDSGKEGEIQNAIDTGLSEIDQKSLGNFLITIDATVLEGTVITGEAVLQKTTALRVGLNNKFADMPAGINLGYAVGVTEKNVSEIISKGNVRNLSIGSPSLDPERFFSLISNAEKEIEKKDSNGDGKEGLMVSSSLVTSEIPTTIKQLGGIDFTQINYLTRPMGSFQGLDLRLPLLSKEELAGIDINKELASVEQMVNARIDVSTDRLKRLLAAMSKKDAFTSQRETQLLPLLLRLCWLKEENGAETTPDFRAVLLIADTGLFVEQGNTKYSLN